MQRKGRAMDPSQPCCCSSAQAPLRRLKRPCKSSSKLQLLLSKPHGPASWHCARLLYCGAAVCPCSVALQCGLTLWCCSLVLHCGAAVCLHQGVQFVPALWRCSLFLHGGVASGTVLHDTKAHLLILIANMHVCEVCHVRTGLLTCHAACISTKLVASLLRI